MVPDWKALLPHRPLDPDTDQYVPPPTNGGERIAQWILADRTTVLVAGPVGIGKSTELARAAKLLQAERSAFLVRLDRFENMKRVTVDQLLLRIAGVVATIAAEELELTLSFVLRTALFRKGVLAEKPRSTSVLGIEPLPPVEASPASMLGVTIAEIANKSRRVSLILDGLEKLPDSPIVSELFDALGALGDDVDIITVLPWSLAFGGADTLLRPGERLVALSAPEVDGRDPRGRDFLQEILMRRLGLTSEDIPADRRPVFERAAIASGGIPRTFLQLVADAGTYAHMRRNDPWPQIDDLDDAIKDQVDSFRRILRKGDTNAILAIEGEDGRELDLERKIRLLTHGVLLERNAKLTVHPLVKPLLPALWTKPDA